MKRCFKCLCDKPPKPGAGWVSIPAETAARIAQILRDEAECLRECHAPRDDWTGEPEAQADHDEWMALADQLAPTQEQKA